MAEDPKPGTELARTGDLVPEFDFDAVIDDADEPQNAELIAPAAMLGDPAFDGTLATRNAARRRQRQRAFLTQYADTGLLREACKTVGISRRIIYFWISEDPLFAAAFERARDIATDVLEAEARRRAVKGYQAPVYFQGEIVGTVIKYSDLLLLALLNAYRPEKFKNRQEHTGKDGGPIAVVHVSYDHNMKPDDM